MKSFVVNKKAFEQAVSAGQTTVKSKKIGGRYRVNIYDRYTTKALAEKLEISPRTLERSICAIRAGRLVEISMIAALAWSLGIPTESLLLDTALDTATCALERRGSEDEHPARVADGPVLDSCRPEQPMPNNQNDCNPGPLATDSGRRAGIKPESSLPRSLHFPVSPTEDGNKTNGDPSGGVR